MEIRMVNGKPKEFKRTVVPPVNPQLVRDEVGGFCHETVGERPMIPVYSPQTSWGLGDDLAYGRMAPKYNVHA